MSPWPGRALLPWIAALALSFAIGVWHPGRTTGPGAAVEGRLLDARMTLRGPLPPPEGTAIVLIDETDLTAMGGFPPPRAALAAAVDAISERGPAAIAMDLLLIDPRQGDAVLARALAQAPGMVASVALGQPDAAASAALAEAARRSGFDATVGMPPGFPAGMEGPTDALAGLVRLGHVNARPDPDGRMRRLPAWISVTTGDGSIRVPGLALAAMRAAGPGAPLVLRGPGRARDGAVTAGAREVALDPDGAIPLVPYGPAGTIPTWSLREVGRAELAGRVVFLGLTGTGLGDRHPTAFDAALPGVALHATLAANLQEGRALRRDRAAWLLDILGSLAAGALGLLAATRPRAVRVGPALIGGAFLLGGTAQAALAAGWWLDTVTLALAFAGSATLGMGLRAARARRRAENLARYTSPLLTEALSEAASPAFEGRAQLAAALFVDVAGWTATGEALGPDGAERFLARFHGAVERAAIASGGVVEQFAGDGAMILFGLPEARDDDAEAALACVQALLEETAREAPPIPIRIGAHMGRVRAAVLGGARQRHVTVTGDVVNTANRLQEVARADGARVAVSDALLQATASPRAWVDRLRLGEAGLRRLRGRTARLHVWTDADRRCADPL
ncbi:CHASE2 domain-containing protein [Jannaschia seohaensis]|uniref:Adenylate cyclase n=1 Tax=Jannaschia seohaensis TaxID=475081 RepID=A0A2Y9BY47_9RHOB|nr:adenylate/guanylate cyclase domain-containing protein [Jannaschia seohaensis]PWJ21386.1 adenylate cyclase [Jannaschia seohaensis]SSA41992.1 adenylate cyclase [Jannaschia seohaensis]